ncbi:MAG TPA: hypothetical protein VGF89_08045 [Steroidobacteraceae bacterium]|jgi:aldose 1-epimerase
MAALSRILLRSGALTLGIAPEWGAALTRFDVRRGEATLPILRPARERDAARPPALQASSFAMLPYCGRLRGGEFQFEGRRYRFPLNALPERHSSHGDGWTRPWELTQLDRSSASLSLPASSDAPLPYSAHQRIELQPHQLRITFTLANEGPDRLPLGIGLHPYFAQRELAQLQADLPQRWQWDDEYMPLSSATNPEREALRRGRPIHGLPAACEYAGWDGEALIRWPSLNLEVRLSTLPRLKHVVLWVPKRQDFFCFEPSSHATDALHAQPGHAAAEDFIVLEPQARLDQRFEFNVAY